MNEWYKACRRAAALIHKTIPEPYRQRTFSGIIGDIKALPAKKALSLVSRKKGIGLQYAYLYLREGIDGGRGYQACAAEALSYVLGEYKNKIIRGRILDVGCAVGVTAGVLSLENVTGFDLFSDLLIAAKTVDSLTMRSNRYAVADMTHDWPFMATFDTVVCGLVCHHLKTQSENVTFFSSANRVLNQSGSLVITLPSGSIARPSQLGTLNRGLEHFGFTINKDFSGLVVSTDSVQSLFWMFLITAEKVSNETGDLFIDPDFGFPLYRTPVSREEKGDQARKSICMERTVRHTRFRLIPLDRLLKINGDDVLVYDIVKRL